MDESKFMINKANIKDHIPHLLMEQNQDGR